MALLPRPRPRTSYSCFGAPGQAWVRWNLFGVDLALTYRGETVSEYFGCSNAAHDKCGLVSINKDAFAFKTHIEPTTGKKPIADVKRTDIEAVIATLDAKIAAGSHSWQTMPRAWIIMSKMFKDTHRSKIAVLRCACVMTTPALM